MLRTAGLAVTSVLLATVAQLMLRSGMEKVGFIGGKELAKPLQLALQVARTPMVVTGLAVFAISAVAWLIVLSRIPLSLAYPFVGLTYVFTALFGMIFLRESVPAARWMGIALIIGGILVVGRTATEHKLVS